MLINKVLITGASGFIGNVLCDRLSSFVDTVVGADVVEKPFDNQGIIGERVDLTNLNELRKICEKYVPDVVIHCAGIAHQKISAVDYATYIRVNSEVTETLARAASEVNHNVRFIFFSSVSVYGEDNVSSLVTEEHECNPSSDYAASKLDAEKRLIALFNKGMLRNLMILRLAPVYDREWSLNLDRRVFAPGKRAYLRFGSGMQKMSMLARPNLVEFVYHMVQLTNAAECEALKENEYRRDNRLCKNNQGEWENKKDIKGGNGAARELLICNVCDAEPYEFKRIIKVFKRSAFKPSTPVIPVPLFLVWIATRIAGILFFKKRKWVHSCYNKVASDLVFDNRKMLGTGFIPIHSVQTTFESAD